MNLGAESSRRGDWADLVKPGLTAPNGSGAWPHSSDSLHLDRLRGFLEHGLKAHRQGSAPPTRIKPGQRTGGEHRCQPVFCMCFQASMALCLSMRRRVRGTGGRGGIQL